MLFSIGFGWSDPEHDMLAISLLACFHLVFRIVRDRMRVFESERRRINVVIDR